MKLYSDMFWPMVIFVIVLLAMTVDNPDPKSDREWSGPKIQDRIQVLP